MAHDGFPQRFIDQDFLVLNVHELADTAGERALGTGLAYLALTWDPKYGYAPVAPNTDGCPGPGNFGIS